MYVTDLDIIPWKAILKVPLKLGIAEFIRRLIFPIRISFFLYSVICQVYQPVSQITNIIRLWAGSNVSLLIPIELQPTLDGHCYHKCPNIELSAIIKQQVFNIWLDYDLFVLTKRALDVIERTSTVDSVATVRVFRRLDHPDCSFLLLLLVNLLECQESLWLLLGDVIGGRDYFRCFFSFITVVWAYIVK